MSHVRPNGPVWRHSRARLDMSAEQAAARLRISPQYLRNIESNQQRATPSVRLVYRAVDLYGIQFNDLISNDATPPEPGSQPEPEAEQPERQRDPNGPPPRRNGRDDRLGPARASETQMVRVP